MTALLYAVDADHRECVRELLSAGASPGGPCRSPSDDDDGGRRTPLVAAVTNNSVSSCRLLLQAGALDSVTSGAGLGRVGGDLAALATDVVLRLLLAAAAALGLPLLVERPKDRSYHSSHLVFSLITSLPTHADNGRCAARVISGVCDCLRVGLSAL